MTDLVAVEARLVALLDRYRPELVDGTIYGVPSLVWPGATGHDYFAALKRGKAKVGLYLVIADRYPDDLAASLLALLALLARRTGRATFSFATLDDETAADLGALLDRLMERYRAEHTTQSEDAAEPPATS
ncbi:hypothetical protein ASG88_05975 [Nocardioides sp. Soil777]|uniref:hypothetical protein n=1 Tax=Nocardioides sp. Soil777 TaxID=1736409 RepID=UPI000702D1E9|nr:hypothetical protein [Nocardioides sp. Soil777]KRF02906.1 hypothetical protein ASG88_05975 [Nocardioides sp. Soil777]